MGLELAKKMQHVMKHPEELPAMMSETMDQLGVPAKDKAEYMKLIQDPAALQAAMEQFAAEGLESSLGGLGDGLEEYTRISATFMKFRMREATPLVLAVLVLHTYSASLSRSTLASLHNSVKLLLKSRRCCGDVALTYSSECHAAMRCSSKA
eukprot:2933-Heterococcus_DN1.PRE.3